MPQFPQDPRVPAAERLARLAKGQAETNATSITGVDGRVTALEANDTVQDADIDAVQAELTTTTARSFSNEAQVSILTASDANQDTAISDLQTDVSTAEGNIATLQGGLTTAQGNITANAGDITALEAAIDGELFGDRAAGGFPGSPTNGELAYSSAGEWAYWDSGRSRWLSVWKEDLAYADQVATPSLNFLKLQAIPTSATFGHYWPFDVCITHGQAICANTTTAATLVLFSASHPAGTAGMTFSSSNKAQVTGLNVLIPAGEVVSCITSGATAAATSAIWYARRVFTS